MITAAASLVEIELCPLDLCGRDTAAFATGFGVWITQG